MVEFQPSKLVMRVRFPSSAPFGYISSKLKIPLNRSGIFKLLLLVFWSIWITRAIRIELSSWLLWLWTVRAELTTWLLWMHLLVRVSVVLIVTLLIIRIWLLWLWAIRIEWASWLLRFWTARVDLARILLILSWVKVLLILSIVVSFMSFNRFFNIFYINFMYLYFFNIIFMLNNFIIRSLVINDNSIFFCSSSISFF